MLRNLLALLLLLVAGSAAEAQSNRSDDGRFLLGVSIALSGPAQEFGQAVKNGFLQAQHENSEIDRLIRFEFQDDRYDARTAVSVFNHLHFQRGVDALFVAGVTPTEAIAPIADRLQVPVIANCQNPTSAIASDYVLRFINESREYSAHLLEHLRQQGYQRFGIVKTEASYNNALIDSIESQLRAGESIEIIGSYGVSDLDFRSAITRLKKGGFDAIGVYLFPGQVSAFFRQAREQRLDVPAFGSDVLDSRSEIQSAGGSMEGVVYAFNVVERAFAARYMERYGSDTQIATAANAYDFAVLLAQIVRQIKEKNGRQSGEAVLQALRGATRFQGVLGEAIYVESTMHGGHFQFPIALRVVQGEVTALLGAGQGSGNS